jgi:sulfite exporter TauE/SafE
MPVEQILIAFITGLTTGGLSCLAVQGGLLASSLAHQIEQDLLKAPPVGKVPTRLKKGLKRARPVTRPNTALPIALFLLAKLVVYTLLGGLLGLLGSFLTFDPITRAILMFAIGIFMVGNALRMLNVHPIFRYFSVEPPKFITRYIRRTARNDTELFTPLFLGALTVFIPCGVTQAMMAAALGAGSPLLGAALMFAFTLGTSPVFFIVAYLTTQLGARLESFFMRFVAVAVLVLGIITFDSGLNLIGSPLSFANLTRGILPSAQTAPSAAAAPAAASAALVLNAANNGYHPETLRARANEAISLELVTNRTYACTRDFVIPALKYYKLLPESGSVTVDIPPQKPGSVLRYTCSMGMYTGQIVFE